MQPLSESTALDDSQEIEANRAKATRDFFTTSSKKANSFHQHLFHAQLYAIVQNDDAPLLHAAMESLRQDWYSERVAQELWHFALLQGKPHTF